MQRYGGLLMDSTQTVELTSDLDGVNLSLPLPLTLTLTLTRTLTVGSGGLCSWPMWPLFVVNVCWARDYG